MSQSLRKHSSVSEKSKSSCFHNLASCFNRKNSVSSDNIHKRSAKKNDETSGLVEKELMSDISAGKGSLKKSEKGEVFANLKKLIKISVEILRCELFLKAYF